MIETVAYTFIAVILYFGSDWILLQVEKASGQRLENRNLVFFGILMILALSSFAVIRLLVPEI